MKTSHRFATVLATSFALAGLAACSHDAPMSDDLKQDLDQASASSVQLAPRANATSVVSAIELGESKTPGELPKTTPLPRAPQRAKAPAKTQHAPTMHVAAVAVSRPQPEPVAQRPTQVAQAPAPEPTPAPAPVIDTPAPMPAPMPMPSRAPNGRASRGGRGGGWSTVGDVIRNAPFPINP